jgi:hypothetical protein
MKFIITIFYLLSSSYFFSQAVYTSNLTGNLNSSSSWTLTSGTDSDANGIPDSNDDVIVLNSHIITLDATSSIKSLTINSGGTFNFAGQRLFIYGDFTNSGGTITGSVNLLGIYGNCTISSTSNFNFGNTLGIYFYNNNSTLTISSGTSINSRFIRLIGTGTKLENNGTITSQAFYSSSLSNQLNNNTGSTFNLISATAEILIQNSLTVSNSINSTFSFLPSSSYSIPNYSYYNLILNGVATKNLTSSLNISNNLTIAAGLFNLGSNNLTVSGNLTNSGTISQNSGTVSISGTTTCSGTSAITVGTLNQTGNFTVSSGTLNFGSSIVNLSGALLNSGTISSSGTINIAGALTFSGSGNLASNNTSTLVMNGSSAQTLTIPNSTTVPFNNFTCSNSSGVSVSGGNLNINNNLNLTSGNLSLGNRSVSIKGNISTSGTGNIASGAGETNAITLNGTIAQTITNTSGSPLNIYNLTCNNSSASINLSSGNLSVNNNLTVTTGTLALGSNNLSVSGNLTNSGTIMQTSGTVSVAGTTTCSGTSAIIVGTLNQTGNFTVSSGTLNFGSSIVNLSGALSNSGTISSSGTINIAGNLSFSATGNLASNNTSTIVMNGSSAQSITNSNSSTVPLYNFTSSNNSGVTLSSGNFSIKNILTVTSGELSVGTNRLTMLSDASSTAIIGNSAGTINGSMILQRYIPAGAARRYDLGSPVFSATINDWDNELYMSIGAPDDVPGYPGGDGTAGGTNSVHLYNNTSSAYVAVTNNSSLQVGRGYRVFVGDDKTSFPGRAIDTRGTPNMGSVALTLSYKVSDGWNLISNPFQAHIAWGIVNKSNVSDFVYFRELSGGTYTYLSQTQNPIIPPGLGFMCLATGANPSVTITQNAKTNKISSSLTDFGNSNRINSSSEDFANLKLRISSTQNPFFNEIDLFFDKKATKGFDYDKDFLFYENLIEDAPIITFSDAGKQFVRNYFNDEIETVYFPLSITTPIAGNYSIDLEGLYESNVYQDAYLMNNLTKEKYKLTNNQTASIYFDKNTHEQFQLVLSKKSTDEINSATTSNLINVFATASDIVIKNGTINQQEVSIKVYSALGQLVLNQTSELSEKSELRIPTETFKSDVYFIQLRTVLGNEFTKKIVITK